MVVDRVIGVDGLSRVPPEPLDYVVGNFTCCDVVVVDVCDLELAPPRRLEGGKHCEDVRRVEVDPGHAVGAGRVGGFLDDALDAAVSIERGNPEMTEVLRLRDSREEQPCTTLLQGKALERRLDRPLEDVVGKHDGDTVVGDEPLGEAEGFCDATGAILVGVVEPVEPVVVAVGEQPEKLPRVGPPGHDHHLGDTSENERLDAVVDHRPVTDWQQVLVRDAGEREEPASRAACQQNTLHAAAHYRPTDRRYARELSRLGAMSADAVVEVSGLRKRFGAVVAVDSLSFSVERGTVVGLLGANGAGKTTTLRMLLGLIRPNAGTIVVLGEPIVFGAKVLARVGSFVEGPGFIPHVSGRHNLELYWRAGGRRAGPAHIDEALATAGLDSVAGRAVKTYSHGMKQRLAFAQALLGKPELLVLDEPANGLDPKQIVFMREALTGLARKGTTILLSSHLLWEVEQTCDKVVVVDQGRLVKSGTVAEVTKSASSAYIEADDIDRAFEALRHVMGIISVSHAPPGIVVKLGTARRCDIVQALVAHGISVETVMARHSLESAFLEMVAPPEDEVAGPGGEPFTSGADHSAADHSGNGNGVLL